MGGGRVLADSVFAFYRPSGENTRIRKLPGPRGSTYDGLFIVGAQYYP